MTIPRMNPPSTAPAGLSSPPTTAAVKPTIRTRSSVFGDKFEVGVMRSPASEDAAPDIAQLIVRVRFVRIPLSFATS